MNITEQLQQKIDLKTKPLGALGKLEIIALQIGTIQNTLTPKLHNPTIIVFAGDHGITDEGVSPFPKEVTFQMVLNFLSGGAAINVFCKQNNITLKVADAGVDYDFDTTMNLIHAKVAKGTNNILKQPAMSVEQCTLAINKGKQIVENEHKNGCNIIGFGEMGIGNTSSASLLMSKYTGIPIENCTGRGTGHDEQGLIKKTEILKKALSLHMVESPIDILATYGGFEIAMMTGAFLRAAELGMVTMVDGFIVTSALLAACKIQPDVLKNCIFTHTSEEKGHKLMLEYLKAEPVVTLNLRLGEGTGAAVVYPIIQSAVAFLNEMASFEQAGVSNI
jgi:nicotinate-nucleotide--dimethylbenzimidazole phosphoribosyltransferase